jgi:hypothetical protein
MGMLFQSHGVRAVRRRWAVAVQAELWRRFAELRIILGAVHVMAGGAGNPVPVHDAVMPIFLFQRAKNLNTNNDWMQWVSFGVRPEVFLIKHLSLAGDCGFDHTNLPGSHEGWLRKCTFAPQIGADRKNSLDGRYCGCS